LESCYDAGGRPSFRTRDNGFCGDWEFSAPPYVILTKLNISSLFRRPSPGSAYVHKHTTLYAATTIGLPNAGRTSTTDRETDHLSSRCLSTYVERRDRETLTSGERLKADMWNWETWHQSTIEEAHISAHKWPCRIRCSVPDQHGAWLQAYSTLVEPHSVGSCRLHV